MFIYISSVISVEYRKGLFFLFCFLLGQGKITILLSDGYIEHLIQFFEVQLSYNDNDNKLTAEVRAI